MAVLIYKEGSKYMAKQEGGDSCFREKLRRDLCLKSFNTSWVKTLSRESTRGRIGNTIMTDKKQQNIYNTSRLDRQEKGIAL